MSNKLKLSAARKLEELRKGAVLAGSKLKDPIFVELLSDGALVEHRVGLTKRTLQVTDVDYFDTVLFKRYGIANLSAYVYTLDKSDVTRAELTAICSDSKVKNIRSFRGFLVNCYQPIHVWLSGKEQQLLPLSGSYLFIHDLDDFHPLQNIVVVGIENPENFRRIDEQRHLFSNITPLFVSRYPQSQSNDLVQWLVRNDLPYLHFGDFDPAGISIFVNEYWKKLGDKANFFNHRLSLP